MKVSCLYLILLTIFVGMANAAMRDSIYFANKYEGGVLPSSDGWIYSGTQPLNTYNLTDGNILTHDTLTTTSFQTSYWSRTLSTDYSKGFTAEIRLKVLSSPNTGNDVNRGYWWQAGRGATLSFFDNSVMHRGGGDEIIVNASNTDNFHTYRIVMPPGATGFDLYRDDVLVVDDRGAGAWEGLLFGDPTAASSSPDTKVQIDYIRWDTTGAYTPVEPMICGEEGTLYLAGDLNKDCYVNLLDIAVWSEEWLGCTDLQTSYCDEFWWKESLDYDAANEMFTSNGQAVMGLHSATLSGPDTDWATSKSGSDNSYLINRVNGNGLHWETNIFRVNESVWEVKHIIHNQGAASIPLNQIEFNFAEGAYNYQLFTSVYSDSFTKNITTETKDIGSNLGYVVLHDVTRNADLHFYIPNWLNAMGNVSTKKNGKLLSGKFYFDAFNDLTNSYYRNLTNPYSNSWSQKTVNLAHGEAKSISYRVGLFRNSEPILNDSQTPLEMGNYYLYRWNRSAMLTMGYPLPKTATQYPGHIMIMDWADVQDSAMLAWAAQAGTGVIVLRSPEFRDISHGISWNGDYNNAPPGVNDKINEIHSLGMKVVWWFSIRGALYSDPARNNGQPDPILVEHPEWFLPNATYWYGLYKYADMFSDGWKQWCIDKIVSDLMNYPIDGFAFDEPYFYGNLVSHDGELKTCTKNGRDFLAEIHSAIKNEDANNIIIANFWFPSADAFDFFDYTMQEGAGISYLTPLTLGKSCGARGIGPLFEWGLILSHFEVLYQKDPVGLGWVHPTWYWGCCRPYVKDTAATSKLLSFLGHAKILAGLSIGERVTQIELDLHGDRYLLIVNASDRDIDVKARILRPLLGNPSRGYVAIDSESTSTYKVVSAPWDEIFNAGLVPARSIYSVLWR